MSVETPNEDPEQTNKNPEQTNVSTEPVKTEQVNIDLPIKAKEDTKDNPIATRTRRRMQVDSTDSISSRTRSHTSSLIVTGCAYIATTNIPNTVDDARATPNAEQWENAMAKKLKSLADNNTWTLVECPLNRKPIANK